MNLLLGGAARLADHSQVRIPDVVLDPATQRVTHLVVDLPLHLRGPHLVPVEVLSAKRRGLELTWTAEQIAAAPRVEEIDYLDMESWPHTSEGWDVGVVREQAPPYAPSTWPLVLGNGSGYGVVVGPRFPGRRASATLFDRIPVGAAEIRHESVVIGSEGRRLGRVHKLVLDDTYRVVALHVETGHVWGRHDRVVPIDDVASIATDIVTLRTPSTTPYPHVARNEPGLRLPKAADGPTTSS